MADSNRPLEDPLSGSIRDQLLSEEMKSSYLTYAMSVIIQRALPDVRDGLKPSQRRILVAMNDLNLAPRGKFRKCSKITGDTTGNYHPHGDQVVYPTLVRLAQDFNMRYPLVDKQGNFGAIDGSPPAAQRYTEARMANAAVDMLDDLDKETVDLDRNYDDTRDEPTVLPARFPNLLCNGSQGIAVGMATSIPPHNLGEVADAVIALIRNPEIDFHGLLEHIKGPDFPTGGIVCGRSGIARAYATGRGQIVVRARTRIETHGKDRERIVVEELPYQVNPVSIFERVKTLIAEKIIEGISYVNDETDRKAGLRLVFEVRKGFQADVVLNQLLRHTALQTTYSMILLALDHGRPRTFTMKELLGAYRDHRVEVIQRRTRYLKRKAEERLHVVEGLLIAIADIDEVVRVIKSSESPKTARVELTRSFTLSDKQADAILAMRLSRLTGLEVEKLENERRELAEAIERYKRILGDVNEVYNLIVSELEDLKVRYAGARRTEITEEEAEIEDEALIPPGQTLVTLSHRGYIKRLPPDTYRSQSRGGKGIIGAEMRDGDFVERLILADTHDTFLVFTTWGWVHWLKVYQIPELGRNSQGRFVENILQLRGSNETRGLAKERVTSIIPVREFDPALSLVTISRQGYVKRTPLSHYARPKRGGIIGAGLKEGDQLIRAALVRTGGDLLVSTSHGQTIRFSVEDESVRSMGRSAAGVIAIRFKRPDDRVVDMAVADDEAMLISVTAKGYGQRTRISEYPRKGRGGQGVVNIRGRERNGPVVMVRVTRGGDDLILISQHGKVVRIPADEVRLVGRGGKGVRVMSLAADDEVVAGVLLSPDEEEGTEKPEGAGAGGPAGSGKEDREDAERDA